MRNAIGVVLFGIFGSLALLHVYWALGGEAGRAAGVPSVGGKRLFEPSRFGTLLVAGALLVAAIVIGGIAGWLGGRVPSNVLRWLTLGISLVFLLRAVGDFRYVGFFRRPSETPFADWDRRLYSPLCLFIAAAALMLVW